MRLHKLLLLVVITRVASRPINPRDLAQSKQGTNSLTEPNVISLSKTDDVIGLDDKTKDVIGLDDETGDIGANTYTTTKGVTTTLGPESVAIMQAPDPGESAVHEASTAKTILTKAAKRYNCGRCTAYDPYKPPSGPVYEYRKKYGKCFGYEANKVAKSVRRDGYGGNWRTHHSLWGGKLTDLKTCNESRCHQCNQCDKVYSIMGGGSHKYCSADSNKGGQLVCDRDAVGVWEQFMLEQQSDNTYAIKCGNENGLKYLMENKNDDNKVMCTAYNVNGWEKFTLEELSDGKYAIKGGASGRYCVDEKNRGTSGMNFVDEMNFVLCNRDAVGAWEKFTLTEL